MKKFGLFISSFLLILVVLSHVLTYTFPIIYEDEAIYLYKGLYAPINLDSGFVWKCLMHFDNTFFYGSNLKIVPLVLGLLGAVLFYLILRKGLKLGFLTCNLVTTLYISSPIFFSQAHRIRPEIINVFFTLLSLLCFIVVYNDKNEKLKFLKYILINPFFILGIAALILIPNTHVMGVLNFPALLIFLVYLIYDKTKSIKKTFIGLGMVGFVLFVSILKLFFVTKDFPPNTFTPNGLIDAFAKSLYWFFDSFKIWFWGLKMPVSVGFFREFLSNGFHLLLEGTILYVLAVTLAIFFIMVNFKNKKVLCQKVLIFSAFVNCIVYFLHIVILHRLNNSYNIMLFPWILILIAGAFVSINYENNKIKVINSVVRGLTTGALIFIFFIDSLHYFYIVYPLRDNNFNKILSVLQYKINKNHYKVSIASCPYNAFLINATQIKPYGDILQENSIYDKNKGFTSANIHLSYPKGTYLIVIARNYYGLGWWRNYSEAVDKMDKIINSNFKVVDEISMPFYNNDPFYPNYKVRGKIKYPMGSDFTYIGGLEKIYILKSKI